MADQRLSGQAGRRLVSESIRRALSRGDLVPGQRLVEQELSDSLGATRGCVREALQDLAAEGLVELVPNRGARVRVVSVEEAVQITECRAALEALCARRAATHASAADRAALLAIGTAMREAVAGGDLNTYSALNRQLHATVAEMSGQQVASGLLDRLKGQMVRYQFRLALRPGRPAQSLPQHLAIIDAVVSGSPEAAEAAARAHLDSVIEELRAHEEPGAERAGAF
ncbi:GntR family transcriptional regulator [Streptomyces sp. J2-1]|uniref:GntR family transcriptional regulator n=1 Tax=Streptomyces corallincola TaxID=2851888 RepID=UPI001C391FEB|nr:GntR family transcriptional regulator [Streptomyces corallincola]MBV2355464.1 GntR family transcriptional regulator [Streptomyces corallincola]